MKQEGEELHASLEQGLSTTSTKNITMIFFFDKGECVEIQINILML